MTLEISSSVLKKPLFWFIVSLFLLAIGTGMYFFLRRPATNSLVVPLASDLTTQTDQTDKLIELVGRHIELPSDEVPSIASITDITQLDRTEFFAPAKNGDIIIVYSEAKKAYLYRPSADKLINVIPISTFASPSATPAL